jgi:hypothetical protein
MAIIRKSTAARSGVTGPTITSGMRPCFLGPLPQLCNSIKAILMIWRPTAINMKGVSTGSTPNRGHGCASHPLNSLMSIRPEFWLLQIIGWSITSFCGMVIAIRLGLNPMPDVLPILAIRGMIGIILSTWVCGLGCGAFLLANVRTL